MKEFFLSCGLALNDGEISDLNRFGEILREYNKVMNLTTITGEVDMWIKHFLDSCLGSFAFNKGSSCCDVGAGGGFPSIPLLIIRKDLKFTLIESTGKKCEYLKHVIKELSLNAEVLCARAEDLGKDVKFREKFDCATARAVASLNVLSEYCLPLVKVGGSFIAYKGETHKELKGAENAIGVLGGKIDKVINFSLPEGAGERNIITVKKIKQTPPEYPRGNGKERKYPL